jgi:hypothetical protein
VNGPLAWPFGGASSPTANFQVLWPRGHGKRQASLIVALAALSEMAAKYNDSSAVLP